MMNSDDTDKGASTKSVLWWECRELPIAILHECAILSPSTLCFIRIMLYMRRRRICSAALQGRRSSEQSLDNPIVQRSRSFGFAATLSKHFAVAWLAFRMARRAGETDVNRNVLQPKRLLHPVWFDRRSQSESVMSPCYLREAIKKLLSETQIFTAFSAA
jgi:hypothetical protein